MKFCMIVLVLLISGCTPAASKNTSFLKGFQSVCEGSISIEDLDGKVAGTRLEVAPGQHAVKVRMEGKPHFESDERFSPDTVCVPISVHALQFSVRSGHTYWFYTPDLEGPERRVTVWESTGHGPESVQIAAKEELISSDKRCFLATHFDACF